MPPRRPARGIIASLVIIWLVVVSVAVIWGLNRVQEDLDDRAATALADAGLAVEIDVDGRDITILGGSEAERAQAGEVLRNVEGVRQVVGGDPVVAEAPDATVLGEVLEAPDATTASSSTTTAPVTTTTAPPVTTTAPVTTTTTTTEPPAGTTLSAPVIEATLRDGRFRLSGIVPDEATAAALLTAANVAYAPFVETALEVVPGSPSAPWLAGAPTGISLLPMITEGTIRVEDGRIFLTGESPNPEYLAAFEATVSSVFGITDVTTDVEISNLAAPTFIVNRSGNTLLLDGVLPNPQIKDVIVGGARAVYGDGVVDDLEVDDRYYVSFWMYTMPGVFQLFSPFPAYEILVEDGVTSGALRQGATFPFDSAELTPELQQILGIAAAILSRDLSLGMAVEGHTDSIGPVDYNQRLSERRAQAAVDFMVAAGIDPARLKAVGFGETVPAAPNDSEENRAINRRAEFIFGPVAEVAGG